jgi:hypothetical protein
VRASEPGSDKNMKKQLMLFSIFLTITSSVHALDISRVKALIPGFVSRLYAPPKKKKSRAKSRIQKKKRSLVETNATIKLPPPKKHDPALIKGILSTLNEQLPPPLICIIMEYAYQKPSMAFEIDAKNILSMIRGSHYQYHCCHELSNHCPGYATFPDKLIWAIHNPFFHTDETLNEELLQFIMLINVKNRFNELIREDMVISVRKDGDMQHIYSTQLDELSPHEVYKLCKTEWEGPAPYSSINEGVVKYHEIKPSSKHCTLSITDYDQKNGGGTTLRGYIYDSSEGADCTLKLIADAHFNKPQKVYTSLSSSPHPPHHVPRLSSEPEPRESKEESKKEKE